ncbi:unnamed protein product [Heterobilharzia americana]|nr:unnamed protein product [Heterobilharzia americana]
MTATSQCSLGVLTDSPHHSPDHLTEAVNITDFDKKPVTTRLSDSTNTCSLEAQLFNEEEKFLAECLTTENNNNNNNNNNKLIDDDVLLTDLHYDRELLQNPYFYNSGNDYDCELTGGSAFNHSPIMSRGFSRHTRKIDNDPTILLTLAKWARIGSSQLHGDDDQIDRINYQFTSVLLLILLTLTGFRQYLSHLPLQCWIPQEFSRSWEEYAEHYCWVTNTYFTNIQSNIPPVNERTTVVRYYQWATFVFILQAAGFFLPCLIWRLLQNHSGFHVQRIIRSAVRINCTPTDSSQTITDGLARYIDSVIYHRSYKTWRIQSSKEKSYVKHKMPSNDTVIKSAQKSSTYAASTSTQSHEVGTETKLVKFEKRPTSTHQSSYQYRTLSSESTVPRSHKKSPAPQPPVTSSIIFKLNSDRTMYTSNPTMKHISNISPTKHKSSSRQNIRRGKSSTSSPPLCCNQCSLCFTNLSTFNKNKNSKSEQPLVPTSTIISKTISTTETSINPTHSTKLKTTQAPASISPSVQQQEQQETSGWTCHCVQNVFKTSLSFTTKKSRPYYQKFSIKYICYHLGYTLCLGLKFIFTLICLIPACSCHWLCGNHKIKGVQRSRSFLFYLYVTVKLLYLANIFGQIYLMKVFLGVKSYYFGIYVLYDLIQGNVWSETGHFPRVTYCDFETKKLGKNYKYTLQCVLPLNLFLEKVYIFLWFWIVFVGVLTLYSLLKWLFRLTIPESRITFISRFLHSSYETQNIDELDPINVRLFVNNYLNLDGVFLLWLISINAGDLIINDLIIALWNLFRARLLAMQSSSLKTTSSTGQNINKCDQNINSLQGNDDFHFNGSNLPLKSSLLELKQTCQYDQQNLFKLSHPCIQVYSNCQHSKQFTFGDRCDSSTTHFNTGSLPNSKRLHSYCPISYHNELRNINNHNSGCSTFHPTDICESSDSIV